MFETRILDINGCHLKHLKYIENPCCDIYSGCMDDQKIWMYVANTERQKKWLEEQIRVIKKDETIMLREILHKNHSLYVISNKEIDISLFKEYDETHIYISSKKITHVLKEAPYLDFAYNRLDIKYGDNYKLLCIENDDEVLYVPYHEENNRAFLGISMSPISTSCFKLLKQWFWENEPNIRYLDMLFLNAYDKQLQAKNNFIIYFDDKNEDIINRLSKKAKYNYKREKRILQDKIGTLYFQRYDRKDITRELVETYFKMKNKTHNRNYGLDWEEYLNMYFVTNAYVLRDLNCIIGILFSCEKTEIVYLENFSYALNYKQYSIGKIMYYEFLCELCRNGKKVLYLLGGDYEYKKHFNSENHICFSGTISKNLEEY